MPASFTSMDSESEITTGGNPQLFVPVENRSKHILKLDCLRLRGQKGAKDEFHLAATVQNLRKMARLIPMGPPALGT